MATNEEWILNFNIAPEDQIDRILTESRRRFFMENGQSHHTIDVTIVRETEKAVLIAVPRNKAKGDEVLEAWVPRSQIAMEGPDPDGLHQLTAPEWILLDKGLI